MSSHYNLMLEEAGKIKICLLVEPPIKLTTLVDESCSKLEFNYQGTPCEVILFEKSHHLTVACDGVMQIIYSNGQFDEEVDYSVFNDAGNLMVQFDGGTWEIVPTGIRLVKRKEHGEEND